MQYSPALGLPTAAGCRCGRSGCSSRTEDGAHSFLGPCHLLHRAARGCRQHRKRHSCRNWAGEGMGSCRMPPELWSGAAGAGGASHPPVAVLTDRGLALGDPSAKCSCNCLAQKGSVAPGTGRGRRGKPTSKSSVRKGVRTTRFIFFPLRCLLPYPGDHCCPFCLPASPTGCSYRPHNTGHLAVSPQSLRAASGSRWLTQSPLPTHSLCLRTLAMCRHHLTLAERQSKVGTPCPTPCGCVAPRVGGGG